MLHIEPGLGGVSLAPPSREPASHWLDAVVVTRRAGPVLFAGVAVAYVVITQLALWLKEPANGGAGLWPAAGLTLAVLVLFPPRLWGWVLAAIAVAELGGDLARGYPLWVSLGWMVGNCVEPLVGALLLRRFGNPRGQLAPLSQLMRFLLLAVVVAPLVGGTIGAAATVVGFGSSIMQVWPAFVIGDTLGVLIVAPVLLALRARTSRQRTEFAGLVAASLLATGVTFAPAQLWTANTGVVLVPCFTWAALRFGVRGTAWLSAVVTLVANTATAFGHGPFAATEPDGERALLTLQAFLAVTVASALILAASVDDLSDGRQVRRALHHQATHDHLTGLPNRAHLAAVLETALQRCARRGGHVGVLLCDVDLFKTVNDTYGHTAGDRYLVEVAQRMAGAVRDGEEIARVGGDEFLVLAEGVDSDGLDAIAERLVAAVQQPVLLAPGRQVTPSLSIGVALSEATRSGDSVFTHADQALYQAKKGGRGRIQHFDAPLRLALRERQLIEDDLPAALGDGQVYCLHQPEVDLATGELFSFESLARWQHPSRGTIPPDRFVPVVESTGLSPVLFATVLEQTLQAQGAWAGRLGFRPAVAVNVSALQLNDHDLVEGVAAALARYGASPDDLWLEVTETVSADPGALQVLSALHESGVRLAIDDFGTGWSSMARLAQHPWDLVKLDRSFIAPLGRDPRAEHLVRAMVVMAHALGMRALAEGVETSEQLDRVRELGCDVAQGFLFSPAVPACEAGALVDTHGRWLGPTRPAHTWAGPAPAPR